MTLSRLEAIQQASEFIDKNVVPGVPQSLYNNNRSIDSKIDALEARWRLIKDTAEFILKDNDIDSTSSMAYAIDILERTYAKMLLEDEDKDEIVGFGKAISILKEATA